MMRHQTDDAEVLLDVEISSAEGMRRLAGLSGPVFVIGRGQGVSVLLKHDDVSRRHAQVEVTGGGLMVRDLSTNGTFLDGKRVAGAQRMTWGQRLKVGPFTLRFLRAETTAVQPVIEPPAAQSKSLTAAVASVLGGYKSTQGGALSLPPRPKARHTPVGVRRSNTPTEPTAQVPPLAPLPSLPTALLPENPRTSEPRISGPRARTEVLPPALLPPPPSFPARVKTEVLPAPPLPQPLPQPLPAPVTSSSADQDRDRLKRWLRGLLLEALDLPSLRKEELEDKALAPRVLALMDEILDEHARELPHELDRPRLRKELADEVLGLGPLEDLIADAQVSEVMVVDRATIYVERAGRLHLTGARFSSEDALRAAIERIVTPLGRRIDESTPMVDARLKDGSRVNAIIPPLALRGPCLTIRKFSTKKLGLPDLIGYGSLDARMARFLTRAVIARRNILVSGGTGSGKTTLLNVLSSAIPDDERIITIEDAAELRLAQPHVVSLETRPANMEGRGEFSIRDLVRNALRMRPDRIVVGECRGGEALDMLQAMNTGHDGSLTTTHANSPTEAIARLETLVLMGGVDLPTRAIREQIAASIHVVVQQARFVDGSRKITSVAEVVGIDDDGTVRLENIFEFHRAAGGRGQVVGEFRATGYMPSFLGEFITMGLCADGDYL